MTTQEKQVLFTFDLFMDFLAAQQTSLVNLASLQKENSTNERENEMDKTRSCLRLFVERHFLKQIMDAIFMLPRCTPEERNRKAS